MELNHIDFGNKEKYSIDKGKPRRPMTPVIAKINLKSEERL